jgi:hypothetical protein
MKRKEIKENRGTDFLIGMLTFVVIYLLIVGSSLYYDIYYQWDLNRFDLDKDGFFGPLESTPEQKRAMERLTSDVGRNLAPTTGLIFSMIFSYITFRTVRLFVKIREDMRGQSND